MGKAHEHPVFAPVCRCVRPFGAGWSPSPNEGVGTVLPPFGRGCEDERKSKKNGNLLYTLIPMHEVMERFYERQLCALDESATRSRVQARLVRQPDA